MGMGGGQLYYFIIDTAGMSIVKNCEKETPQYSVWKVPENYGNIF